MKVVKALEQLTPPSKGTVVTIGNFDGVHLGHREIFRKVVRKARELDAVSAVLTFEPHPLRLLAPVRAPLRINTPEEKVRLIEASCIDLLVVAKFTRELAALPARRFVEEILIGRLGVRSLIVGYDYAFGRGREGDIPFLQDMAAEHGFELEVLEPIRTGGEVYSSTRIRKALLAGAVADVVAVLGRNFTLDGVVVHGDSRGRALGFPTANLATTKELLPLEGVYAVKVKWHEQYFEGVVSLGRRPTFPGASSSLEIHIFDFTGDLYDESLRIYFVDRIRGIERFASVSELQAAVAADISRARELLAEAEVVEYREYLDCGYGSVPG